MDRVGGNKKRMMQCRESHSISSSFPRSLSISSAFPHSLSISSQTGSKASAGCAILCWSSWRCWVGSVVQDADDVDAADDVHDADDVDAAGDVDAADDSKRELGITDGCQNQVVRPPSCCWRSNSDPLDLSPRILEPQVRMVFKANALQCIPHEKRLGCDRLFGLSCR